MAASSSRARMRALPPRAGFMRVWRSCSLRPPKSDTDPAGALFHMVDEMRDVLVHVVMVDAAEMHVMVADRTRDSVAMHHAMHAFAEHRAAFGAAHPYFQVLDGIAHSDPHHAPDWLTPR